MAILNIEPTTYTRSDGITMIKLPSNNWIIRRGATCEFFDKTKKPEDRWVFNSIYDIEKFGLTFDEAYQYLCDLSEEQHVFKGCRVDGR